MLDNITLVAFFDELEKIALNRTEKELLKKEYSAVLPKGTTITFKPKASERRLMRKQLGGEGSAGTTIFTPRSKKSRLYVPKKVLIFRGRMSKRDMGVYKNILKSQDRYDRQLFFRQLNKKQALSIPRITSHELGHIVRGGVKSTERQAERFSLYAFIPKYRKALLKAGLKVRF